MYRKRRNYKHQDIDESPCARDPRIHLVVASLVYRPKPISHPLLAKSTTPRRASVLKKNVHKPNNTPRQNRLESRHGKVHNGRDPQQLPRLLARAVREERNHDGAEVEERVHNQRPDDGEAPRVTDVVERVDFVLRLVGQVAHVEGGEGRRLVVGRHLVVWWCHGEIWATGFSAPAEGGTMYRRVDFGGVR